jgi:peptide/nickel transport system substrate-binding protein
MFSDSLTLPGPGPSGAGTTEGVIVGIDTTRRPRARVRLLWALVALGLVAAACGGNDDETGSDEPTGAQSDVSEAGDPVPGGSITVGTEAETNNLLPGTGTFANSGANVAYAIYDPLVRLTPEGTVEPYLAESIEANEDSTEWTVTLRPGVTFHDGTELDAQTMKTIFDDYLKAPGSNLAESALREAEEMVVVDDLTFTYRLSTPNSAFPVSLAGASGWPFSVEAAQAAGEDAGLNPVGTGPFVFESWERDSRLVVTKNPDYWQEGLPYLDEIVFRPIPDEDARVASLGSGDVDAIMTLRQSSVRKVRDLDGVDSYEHLGNNTGVNILNTSEPPLDDVRVRQAVARAIDQDAVIDVLGGTGLTPRSTQLFSEDDPYWSEAVAEAWPSYDPESALELVDEYVNDPDRSDGKAVGEPISFRYDCLPDASLTDLATTYQGLWAQVGIEADLRSIEGAQHVEEAMAGDYQVKCFRQGADSDPYPVLRSAFAEDSAQNWTRLTDPTITENLTELAASSDVDERKELVEEIMMIVNENAPMTYSASTLAVLATQESVKNLDGWEFPSGEEGSGTPGATTMWAFVWNTDQ